MDFIGLAMAFATMLTWREIIDFVALVFEDVRDCMREVSCPAVDRL